MLSKNEASGCYIRSGHRTLYNQEQEGNTEDIAEPIMHNDDLTDSTSLPTKTHDDTYGY